MGSVAGVKNTPIVVQKYLGEDVSYAILKCGKIETYVTMFDRYVVVFSGAYNVNGEPLVMLVKKHASAKEALKDFPHVVGKLALKEEDSKYFICPKFDEHWSNGKGSVSAKDKEAIKQYINNCLNRETEMKKSTKKKKGEKKKNESV